MSAGDLYTREISAGSNYVMTRLTKHHLQEAFSVNAPPTMGPQELASATTHPVIPWYFPLSFKETTSETEKKSLQQPCR